MKLSSFFLIGLIGLSGTYAHARNIETDSLNKFSVEKNISLAKEALDYDIYEEALDYLNMALYKDPKNKDALFLRAQVYEDLGENDKALTDYNALIYLFPDFSEALFNRGKLRYDQEKYQLALMDFENLTSLPPKDTQAVFYKIEKGQDGVSQVSTVQKMSDDVENYLGLCYIGLKAYQKAIDHFTNIIKESPNELNAYINRARAYEGLDDKAAAKEDYEFVLDADPNNYIAKYNLTQLKGDDFIGSQAIKNFSSLIEDNPFAYEAYGERALVYYQEGNYEKALDDFTKAIEMNGEDPVLWNNRGLTNVKLNKTDDALKDFNQAIKLKNDYSEAYFSIGNIFYNQKNYEAAIANYNIAEKYQQQNPQIYFNRGISKLYLKKDKEACEDLQKASLLGMKAAESIIQKKCSGLLN